MQAVRLSKRVAEEALLRSSRYEVFDANLKGFGLRVAPSGQKSWIVLYRAGDGGRNAAKRRVTIGSVGTLTAEEARSAAQKILSSAKLGADPANAKAERRAAPTVRELAKAFMKQHVEAKRKPKTALHYAHILDRIVDPALGSLKADAVRRADLARLHLGLASTPFHANRVLAVVGSMYAFGERLGLVPDGCNPARGIERYTEVGRERFLSISELERIGGAIREAETVGLPWNPPQAERMAKHLPKDVDRRRTVIAKEAVAALRLLIFTGARLREILELQWDEVDIQRGVLLLEKSKTGRKTIILNTPALAVLTDLKRVSTYVIPGEPRTLPDGTKVDRPRSDLNRPWATISRHAGLDDVRLHDLRHTFASYGACNGFGLPVIGKLLGHTQASTTQRYAHIGSDPLRRASDVIAEALATAMGECGSAPPDEQVDHHS